MNLPDLLCDLRSSSGPSSPCVGWKTNPGLAVPCHQGGHLSPSPRVGLSGRGDGSYDEPPTPVPEGPLPTGVPGLEGLGSFLRAKTL